MPGPDLVSVATGPQSSAKTRRTSDSAAFEPPGSAESRDHSTFPSRLAPAEGRPVRCSRENKKAATPSSNHPAIECDPSDSAVPCGTESAETAVPPVSYIE